MEEVKKGKDINFVHSSEEKFTVNCSTYIHVGCTGYVTTVLLNV